MNLRASREPPPLWLWLSSVSVERRGAQLQPGPQRRSSAPGDATDGASSAARSRRGRHGTPWQQLQDQREINNCATWLSLELWVVVVTVAVVLVVLVGGGGGCGGGGEWWVSR